MLTSLLMFPATLLCALFFCLDMAHAQAPKALPSKKVKSTEGSVQPTLNAPADSGRSYQFNTLGTSANTDKDKRPAFQFKVADPSAAASPTDVSANPIENYQNDLPFQTYPGYPKHSMGVSLTPRSVGFNQKYGNGPDFNFSASTLQAWALDYRLALTPSWSLSAEYSTYQVKAPAQTASPYTILESTATNDALSLEAAYCQIGDHFAARLCPSILLGYDSYSSLEFGTSGTTLSLTNVRDTILGAGFMAQYPMTPFWTLSGQLVYAMGLKTGQSSTLTVKQNSRYQLKIMAERQWQENSAIEFGFDYSLRDAEVEGKVGSITDNWKTKASVVGLKLGYRYQF